jgi:hypothetical protein
MVMISVFAETNIALIEVKEYNPEFDSSSGSSIQEDYYNDFEYKISTNKNNAKESMLENTKLLKKAADHSSR